MITLYHGTYLSIPKPLAKVGRKNLDFGPGFYLTQIESQARDWATIIASRKGRETRAIVNIYNFDYDNAVENNVKFKIFNEYNIEWLDYVVNCRKGKDVSSIFDVVEGGVANDNVIDTVEDYENGIITAEQALGQLVYKKVNHQICIRSQGVIDTCLNFIGAEIL